MKETKTLVVGASISGLASAACLQKQGVEHIIIEKTNSIGTPWRNHYQRLHLHTNKRISNLPYKKFSTAVPRYPSRRQVVEYLDEYQKELRIEPVFNTEAKKIRKDSDAWITETSDGIFRSKYVIIATGVFTMPVQAYDKTAAQSASLTSTLFIEKADERVTQLRNFLVAYNSPLADSAEVFIQEADRNNLDWKFVAAISGVESGFGKRIPPYSYNGWGWGVYGGKVTRFSSWNKGIVTISRDLRVKYIDKWGATDIASIGQIYAASPTWAQKVQYFMNKIETYEDKPQLASLPISL